MNCIVKQKCYDIPVISSLIVSFTLRFAIKASLYDEIVSYCFVRVEICYKSKSALRDSN